MKSLCDVKYISASCNCSSHVLTFLSRNILCYASNKSLNICSYSEISSSWRIIKNYHVHADAITCIRNIEFSGQGIFFFTASCDNTAAFWNYSENHLRKMFELKGHKDAITVIDAINNKSNSLIIATASNDNNIMIWANDNQVDPVCTQIIKTKSFIMDMKFHFLEHCLVLAVAGDDNLIHIYYQGLNGQFVRMMSLKGHEDWVRCLAFYNTDFPSKVLLASGSQDNLVRIWNLRWKKLDRDSVEEIIDVSVNRKVVEEFNIVVTVSLETILSCHQGWITGLQWALVNRNGPVNFGLFTSSFDKSVIFWSSCEPEIWSELFRVGEVGGTTGGFYSCIYDSARQLLLANSYNGAIYCWKYNEVGSIWSVSTGLSGHKGEVSGLDWEKSGLYLLSGGADETTRLHAPWVKDDQVLGWYELARPQIHGHAISTIASMSPLKFVSGAEEKILRSFQAPVTFVENFSRLSVRLEMNESVRVYGASLRSLGLTNQAIYDIGATVKDTSAESKSKLDYPEPSFKPVSMAEAPSEDVLQQSTLWAEIHKLYGHGNELYCVTCNSDGSLLASGCKSTNKENAAIILWKTSDWSIVEKLHQHVLTVTQLKFSPNDAYLLSVSRDRTWTIFTKKTGDEGYSVLCSSGKHPAISRIIWSCDWTWDSRYFVTGSRDKRVVMWGLMENCDPVFQVKSKFDAADSVTSVSVLKIKRESIHLLAAGFEKGEIALLTFDVFTNKIALVHTLPTYDMAHCMAVTKLCWKPCLAQLDRGDSDTEFVLASCGEDSYVKIYSVGIDIFNALE